MHTHTAPTKTQELKQKYSSKKVWVMLKAQKTIFFRSFHLYSEEIAKFDGESTLKNYTNVLKFDSSFYFTFIFF